VAIRSVEQNANASADALNESGNASRLALRELAKAHQELATRSMKTLTAADQRLSAVKSPAEFIELQQMQIREGVLDALSGSQQIARLTAAVITAAFGHTKARFEAVRKTP
jgi:hypothetical protein